MGYKSRTVTFLDPGVPNKTIATAVDNFNQEIWLPLHSFDSEKNLYHYTGINGLKGIIESRTIWFSHINSLNDPNEIQYGKKIINDILDDRRAKNNNSELEAFLLNVSILVNTVGTTIHQPFIFCFCESPNVLSQWRSYGENGKGYCLGFNFSDKTYLIPDINNISEHYEPYLRKVIYVESEQKKLINTLIDRVVDAFLKSLEEIPDNDKNYYSSAVSGYLTSSLIDMILTFKSEAFIEEQEWRLLRVTLADDYPNQIEIRIKDDEMIPFRKSSLVNKSESEDLIYAIKSIHFGPSIDEIKAKTAIEHFIISEAFRDAEISLPEYYRISIDGIGYKIR